MPFFIRLWLRSDPGREGSVRFIPQAGLLASGLPYSPRLPDAKPGSPFEVLLSQGDFASQNQWL